MFEHLFGSKTRVKLMKVFLDNPDQRFFVRELTRLTDSLINSVRRELDNLVKLELVLFEDDLTKVDDATVSGMNAKKYYYLNPRNVFQKDLLNLFAKGKYIMENRLSDSLVALPGVKYVSLGGFFVEDQVSDVDVMIVIDEIGKESAKALFAQFEKENNRPIRYTIMDLVEFNLRSEINDKFLKHILSNPKNLVVVDNLPKPKTENK